MLDDKELVERLQRLSGPELLDAIAIATGGKTIEVRKSQHRRPLGPPVSADWTQGKHTRGMGW